MVTQGTGPSQITHTAGQNQKFSNQLRTETNTVQSLPDVILKGKSTVLTTKVCVAGRGVWSVFLRLLCI